MIHNTSSAPRVARLLVCMLSTVIAACGGGSVPSTQASVPPASVVMSGHDPALALHSAGQVTTYAVNLGSVVMAAMASLGASSQSNFVLPSIEGFNLGTATSSTGTQAGTNPLGGRTVACSGSGLITIVQEQGSALDQQVSNAATFEFTDCRNQSELVINGQLDLTLVDLQIVPGTKQLLKSEIDVAIRRLSLSHPDRPALLIGDGLVRLIARSGPGSTGPKLDIDYRGDLSLTYLTAQSLGVIERIQGLEVQTEITGLEGLPRLTSTVKGVAGPNLTTAPSWNLHTVEKLVQNTLGGLVISGMLELVTGATGMLRCSLPHDRNQAQAANTSAPDAPGRIDEQLAVVGESPEAPTPRC